MENVIITLISIILEEHSFSQFRMWYSCISLPISYSLLDYKNIAVEDSAA